MLQMRKYVRDWKFRVVFPDLVLKCIALQWSNWHRRMTFLVYSSRSSYRVSFNWTLYPLWMCLTVWLVIIAVKQEILLVPKNCEQLLAETGGNYMSQLVGVVGIRWDTFNPHIYHIFILKSMSFIWSFLIEATCSQTSHKGSGLFQSHKLEMPRCLQDCNSFMVR